MSQQSSGDSAGFLQCLAKAQFFPPRPRALGKKDRLWCFFSPFMEPFASGWRYRIKLQARGKHKRAIGPLIDIHLMFEIIFFAEHEILLIALATC